MRWRTTQARTVRTWCELTPQMNLEEDGGLGGGMAGGRQLRTSRHLVITGDTDDQTTSREFFCGLSYERKATATTRSRRGGAASSSGSGVRRFQCSYCPNCFPTDFHLQRHVRIHTGERPYHCSHCPAAFTRKDHLQLHVRSHTGERPFTCRFCPKAYARRDMLRCHLQTHHHAC